MIEYMCNNWIVEQPTKITAHGRDYNVSVVSATSRSDRDFCDIKAAVSKGDSLGAWNNLSLGDIILSSEFGEFKVIKLSLDSDVGLCIEGRSKKDE